jgi:FtsP/CotA-like multicopper oxidase with cupredoxin domain
LKRILACFSLVSLASSLHAQQSRSIPNPPLLDAKPQVVRTLIQGAKQPPAETQLELNIAYTDGTIWNPATKRFDQVSLRSYRGTSVNPDVPFASPTIQVAPGDTIRLTLNNQLPSKAPCPNNDQPPLNCAEFNRTNLHTHGLWVNPGGNGDNVLLSINPGVSFQFEYKIPPDHPAGTFWYHTHRHGSTALQVSSGMGGALIVRGSRLPTTTQTGDLDTLLQPTKAQPMPERIVVMQQIQYACRDAAGKIKYEADGKTYRCDEGDTGGIEGYDQFGPNTWPPSGRYTTLNGLVLPTFRNAKAGQIERWRLIHAGVRDTINLEFREMPKPADTDGLKSEDVDAFVGANCTGSPLLQHVVAADGLTMAAAMKRTSVIFQPAYRWDSLVVFPKAGRYCVIDNSSRPADSINEHAPSRDLLGFVDVDAGTDVTGDLTAYVTTALVSAASLHMPSNVKAKVTADLNDGLKFSSFIPHADLPEGNDGNQSIAFNIANNQYTVNNAVYGTPEATPIVLKLDDIDEWTLTSTGGGSHPFHIHINPFRIEKILDANGNDVSAAGAVDGTDTQYPGMKGVWKDTIFVKTGGYQVVTRTKYERYVGDFVLHCHILDHEDHGMMRDVSIVLPDGEGGATAASHQH